MVPHSKRITLIVRDSIPGKPEERDLWADTNSLVKGTQS